MGPAVYVLGTLTTLMCSILLIRGYLRSQARLLLWSGMCFFGLAISNLLLFIDLVLYPQDDLYLWRLMTAAVAMMVLNYGLIWDSES